MRRVLQQEDWRVSDRYLERSPSVMDKGASLQQQQQRGLGVVRSVRIAARTATSLWSLGDGRIAPRPQPRVQRRALRQLR